MIDTQLILIIVIFSAIQSIFGVGLLLFGTPTLLLIGYPYIETLWILLPCSIIISLIQSIENYSLVRAKNKIVYFTIPAMTLGLIFIMSYDHAIDIKKVVGIFLIFIGIVKFSPKLQIYLQSFVEKHLKLYYVLIGFIHGVSNMGGGPLSILMSTVYTDKVKIRVNIAFIYLVLASFQLAILSIIDSTSLKYANISLMIISLGAYLVANKYISDRINDKKYIILINILILIYGILAFLRQ